MRGKVVPYRQHPGRSTNTDQDSSHPIQILVVGSSGRIVRLDRWGRWGSRLVELPLMSVLAVVSPFVGSACHSVTRVSCLNSQIIKKGCVGKRCSTIQAQRCRDGQGETLRNNRKAWRNLQYPLSHMAGCHQKSSFSSWASTASSRVSTLTMPLQEVILCSTSSQQPTVGAGAIVVHDIQTGAILASFKQTNAGPKGVAVLESKSTQGGFILAAQSDKSIMNVYNYQKVSVANHLPAMSNDPQPGSTSLEDRSSRKAQLHCC